ncbi:uncharacterized protein LOC121921720 [Sceloporus undulatus]|uniref:uncharacterized protein LOC121921720 n=1 Tax=Sceloporus undulatus TaxID=8520 RepID=UPI001C4ADC87|nr:uncharacterized protein LOC121921720 [Sceloporus undulatus]
MVSVPPPESRPVPSTSPVLEPVKTPTPSLPALSRTVPLEPRVLLTSDLSVPADSLQIVNVDSASEGELQDSYAPFSPQRPRSRSPSPSPTRRPRSASRDRATLGTEANEALAAHHRPPADHDRDLFQAFPDLVHDQRTGQYLIPVDPSHLCRDLRAHLQGHRPDDDTSRRDDRDDLGTSDPLFRRRSPSPSRSGSGSPRSASPVSNEDTPFVPQGPSVPSPTDDVRAFADRVIRMADALKLEVAHPEDDALDPVERRIHGSAPAPPALAYLPSLEKIVKRSWDAPATILSTSRRIENLYRVTPSAPSWLSNHPKLNSAIVEGAQSTFAPKASSSPVDKDSKKLDALTKKFYASAALDLKIANYVACMGAYVQSLVEKMDPTIADLPEEWRRMMAALRNEIHLMAGQQIISARHSTDCASKILSGSIALRRYAWLRSSDLTPQAKAAIEDMPFDNSGLFNRDTDEKLSFRYRMKTAARKHGRLLVRDARLERRLLSHSDPGGPLQVPRLRCWTPGIPVQGPSLWPFHSSKSLHEVHGTRGGLPTSEGNHSLPVPGRLALRSILKGRPAQAVGFCPIPATSTRTTGQLRQVQPDSYQANRLHRFNTGLCTDEGVPSRDKVPSPLCISAALPSLQARAVQVAMGHLASTTFVTPWARLRLRPIQSWFLSVFDPVRDTATKLLTIPRTVQRSLRWWLQSDNVCVGMPFLPPQPDLSLTTDASLQGWGAHTLDLTIKDRWSPAEATLHINVLEMFAVDKALRAFQAVLADRVVLLLTDNTTVMYYLNKQGGTKSRTLLSITICIWEWCIDHKILLQCIHLPGDQNDLADRLSRSSSTRHEWRLHPEVVSRLFNRWGTPLLDLFASWLNTHTVRFCSRYRDPRSEGDAFQFKWTQGLLYAFPPFPLITRVFSKMLADHTDAILVTPWWPRQPWFASLLQRAQDHLRLENRPDLLSLHDGLIHHPEIQSLPLVAWRIQS